MTEILPALHQPPLPTDRLIRREPLDAEHLPMDVVFVGGGPAGLAGAIALAKMVRADAEAGGSLGDVQIAVLEKASALGEHSLSGAVVNPVSLRALFPEVPDGELPLRRPVERERVYFMTGSRALRIPTPPTMRNDGNWIASVCEIVRWMGEKAEALGVNVFTGFPAEALLADGDRVIGVRTTPSGLTRDRQPGSDYAAPTDIGARITVLTEGTRGALAQAYTDWKQLSGRNPQIFALGVKELWETKRPLDAIIHTLGWPVPRDAFGGSFIYPLEPNVVALGLVVGLDYRDAALDVHEMLQRFKAHPLVRPILEGGELAEWGAKTIPEGGWWALPTRRSGDGVLIAGDAAGFVEVASLKGIHYAIQSGILAAKAIFEALKRGDTSAATLGAYDAMVNESFIARDLYERRNMRLVFQRDGFFVAGLKAALMSATKGKLFGGHLRSHRDADEPRRAAAPARNGGRRAGVPKLEAVYKSGNATRDTIPSHLVVGSDVPPEVAAFYAAMCPAGVYEVVDGRLVVNAPNCVDCKATDVLGPRWLPREGGSGPKYRRM